MNVHLHIERLVLDGVAMDPAQQVLLGPAVSSELVRMIQERHGLSLQTVLDTPLVKTPPMPLARDGQSGVALGQGIARAIHEGLSR